VLSDPDTVMARRQRPTPRSVVGVERAGTLFHEWVEGHYRERGITLLSVDVDADVEPGVDALTGDVADFATWQTGFLASEFANRTPVAIEREIHLPIAGRVVVCKIDAVFDTDTGVDIIDWKTGKPPATPAQEQARSLQLSLYRLAWASWADIPLEHITAGWWFSQTGEVVRPRALMSFDELETALTEAITRYEAGETNS
jgi:DNA helicase II / ATP-dependent DNA helicase PcrA